MNIDRALRELGKAIQADERFKTLKAAAEVNDKDEKLQDQMHEMQLLSMQYQQENAKDDTDDAKIEEYQNKYQAIYDEIMQYDDMKAYQAAATKVDDMAQYISKMIGLFFDGQDPETAVVEPENCTHDCATCTAEYY